MLADAPPIADRDPSHSYYSRGVDAMSYKSEKPDSQIGRDRELLRQQAEEIEQLRREVFEAKARASAFRQAQSHVQQDVRPPPAPEPYNRNTESRQRERYEAQRMQEELLKEIEALKGNNLAALQRPGTASADVASIRAEKDQLLFENSQLKQ